MLDSRFFSLPEVTDPFHCGVDKPKEIMSATTSYNNSGGTIAVQGEVEFAADPASGAFFQPDYKKNDDLKMMLDSSKDSLKLEAMKRIIGMIAKGRDASDLFPAVVKNVVSKNIEVKKLVYVYLVRYAEEQQDLALLSISTFQRALKDPNQLIRASALRVLSSIRVSMIVPIVMLAIRESSSDMSPYVRKTAAHAIPKLYSLDPTHAEELVSIIDKLLSDKAPLVVGSAAMAFSEVCPERSALIHRSYRKLCSLLADVDEWGQLVLLSVLTRYAREHFCDPNADEQHNSAESGADKPFYDESDSDGSRGSAPAQRRWRRTADSPTLDADHKTLLRAAKPLLQSRNAGVVMAVAQLFYHAGPACDMPLAAKALIRLLRGPFEVQSVVLHSIASLTITKRSTFEPYLKSFFVRTSDPTHIKLLKLEILTNLATEGSAPAILREFQTYVTSSDKAFAGATIRAIGRIATDIDHVTETCLNGLLHLLSSKDEWVAGAAVVVVKRVVGGSGGAGGAAAVARAARLLRGGRLAAGARAAALWLLAEHGARGRHAPALLAHFVPQFGEQEELVKLQLLSLAVKLSVTQPDTLPLARHVLTLARYDACYDVRDRARLLRKFVEPEEGRGRLLSHAAMIFLEEKPVPLMESKFKDRQQYTLGSLSHCVGARAAGYAPLPAFPEAVRAAGERDPDRSAAAPHPPAARERPSRQDKGFYSEPESSGSSSSDSSGSDDSSDDEEQTDHEEKAPEKPEVKENAWNYENSRVSSSGTSDSESDSNSSRSSSAADSSSEDSTPPREQKPAVAPREASQGPALTPEKSNLELLLELDEAAGALPIMTPSYGGFLSPLAPAPPPAGAADDSIVPVSAGYVEKASVELLSRLNSGGLSAERRYTRAPHLFSQKMAAVELTFRNHTADSVADIRVGRKTLTGARAMHEFAPVGCLPPGAAAAATLGVDFADTIQPVNFTIHSSLGETEVSITPPVGELMRSVGMSAARWDSEQRRLRGMTECDKKGPLPGNESVISQKVLETANLGIVTPSGTFLRYAGRLLSSQDLVLVSVRVETDSTHTTVNCANMAIASMLLNQIVNAFT